jgi:hypothetical protein
VTQKWSQLIHIEPKGRKIKTTNIGFGNTVTKHPETEGQQYKFREKMKEDIQKLWHNADLLLMSKRHRFSKSKENSKLIKPKN